jgi:hypothetical protein
MKHIVFAIQSLKALIDGDFLLPQVRIGDNNKMGNNHQRSRGQC